jgi:chemotaxis protein methyltransferase CheR
MTKDLDFPGYEAKKPERTKGPRARLRRLKRELYAAALLPYGIRRHRRLLETCERTNSHTYTCFLRAPSQLAAVAGPVLDFLGSPQNRGRKLQILMFACSNGAEAFTLASWLRLHVPALDFQITASDLHEEMVQRCLLGEYSAAEALQSEYVTNDFVEATFDRVGERYIVKPSIRRRVAFRQANLLDTDGLAQAFSPADIVTVQNVLFHMNPAQARVAFGNVASFLKPRSVLLVEGMDLDLRVELTREHSLHPLDVNLRRIHAETRVHTPRDWWNYYWGTEPYFPLRALKQRRYSTIFLRGAGSEL